MAHDHSRCTREHHRNYDESPIGESLSIIGTLVFMYERGEASDEQVLSSIINVINSYNEPWSPIELNDFLENIDQETASRIRALPDDVLVTYQHHLRTNKRAFEIANDLGIDEVVVWSHMDSIQDAIHAH